MTPSMYVFTPPAHRRSSHRLLTRGPLQFEEHGIRVVGLGFADGELPPHALIEDWLDLLAAAKKETSSPVIAVHCVAGLGRAPVLVVIALIERYVSCAVDHALPHHLTVVRSPLQRHGADRCDRVCAREAPRSNQRQAAEGAASLPSPARRQVRQVRRHVAVAQAMKRKGRF